MKNATSKTTKNSVLYLATNSTLRGIQATYVMVTNITTQARHDCEKIAIKGLEPASQDLHLASSQEP